MKKTKQFVQAGVFGLLVLLLISVPWQPLVSAAPESRCSEIHEELARAGIPVEVVRQEHQEYVIVYSPGCSDDMKLEGDAIMKRILEAEPIVIVVSNLQDALVVLRFEPHNESALQLVKERYEALRSAASEGGD